VSLSVSETRDRPVLEGLLRQDAELRLYELGDLDPFFWPRTRWFLGQDDDGPRGLVLLYEPDGLPCVLAHGREGDPAPGQVLEAALDQLPDRFYAHLQPGLAARLAEHRQVESSGAYWRMVWRDPGPAEALPADAVEPLGIADLEALEALYARAYPANWFDRRMLETGMYSGVREGDDLIAVAGIHVYAPTHGVAALGNITTHPDHRGRGLAKRVTASLCLRLRAAGATTVGLNVAQANAAAIACYRSIGFEVCAAYEEALVTRGRG
jgi:ribosomal protein S18 acetylase RimI-like enzyme